MIWQSFIILASVSDFFELKGRRRSSTVCLLPVVSSDERPLSVVGPVDLVVFAVGLEEFRETRQRPLRFAHQDVGNGSPLHGTLPNAEEEQTLLNHGMSECVVCVCEETCCMLVAVVVVATTEN